MSFNAPPSPQPNRHPDQTNAVLAHALALVTGFIGPVIILATSANPSFSRQQAVESLNFQITAAFAWIAVIILAVVGVGFLLIPVVAIAQFVLPLIATIKVSNGEDFSYPFTLRLVK